MAVQNRIANIEKRIEGLTELIAEGLDDAQNARADAKKWKAKYEALVKALDTLPADKEALHHERLLT